MFRWKVSTRNIRCVLVMPALVAGIRVFVAQKNAWMPGTQAGHDASKRVLQGH
jgi:hypothetical protein